MKVRILGLDPGLRRCGWGIVESAATKLTHVAHGVIHPSDEGTLAQRLVYIDQELTKILRYYTPNEAAVEETFVNHNPTSTLKLGMARGVVLLAPGRFSLPIGEYSANRVKKAVTGVGHGSKIQVSVMVQYLLPTAGDVKEDAADALAVAICHAHFRASTNRLKQVL